MEVWRKHVARELAKERECKKNNSSRKEKDYDISQTMECVL